MAIYFFVAEKLILRKICWRLSHLSNTTTWDTISILVQRWDTRYFQIVPNLHSEYSIININCREKASQNMLKVCQIFTLFQGQYFPSYLACPEAFTWHPMEQCGPKLDANKYSRFAEAGVGKTTLHSLCNTVYISLFGSGTSGTLCWPIDLSVIVSFISTGQPANQNLHLEVDFPLFQSPKELCQIW